MEQLGVRKAITCAAGALGPFGGVVGVDGARVAHLKVRLDNGDWVRRTVNLRLERPYQITREAHALADELGRRLGWQRCLTCRRWLPPRKGSRGRPRSSHKKCSDFETRLNQTIDALGELTLDPAHPEARRAIRSRLMTFMNQRLQFGQLPVSGAGHDV